MSSKATNGRLLKFWFKYFRFIYDINFPTCSPGDFNSEQLPLLYDILTRRLASGVLQHKK